MKRYLLPLAICFFWATPIQVSVAGVCPEKGSITPECKNFFLKNASLTNSEEVLKCIEDIEKGEGRKECEGVLDAALDQLPKMAITPGASRDLSAGIFIKQKRIELKDQLKQTNLKYN